MAKRENRKFVYFNIQTNTFISKEVLCSLSGYGNTHIYRQIPNELLKGMTLTIDFKIKGEKTCIPIRVTRIQ